MFNRLARDEFVDRLSRVELAPSRHPRVNTFHSLAYRLVSRLQNQGLLPRATLIEDEQITILANQAIREACREAGRDAREAPVDAEEAVQAIGLWKGSLIRPEHAGYHGHELMPAVYVQFERLRAQRQLLTYDDFVPLAVDFLATVQGDALLERWGPQFLIVDEYQDVELRPAAPRGAAGGYPGRRHGGR